MTDVVFFLVNLSEKGQGYLPCGTGIFVSNNAGLCVIIQVESGLQDKLRFMRPSEELRTIHRYIYIYICQRYETCRSDIIIHRTNCLTFIQVFNI